MAIERDRLDVDILYVGAGPATLASAIRIADLCQKHGVELPSILVIEKAEEIGGHQLSGAAMVPTPIAELIPEYREKGFPFHHEVTKDRVYLFTEKRAIRFPLPPPQFANHGNLIVSLSEVVKWLKDQAEARGIEIYPGFSAAKVLFDGERVIGVQIQDRGIDKDGAQKSTFEAGAEIHARGVVLGDGPRGSCTKQLLERQPHLAGPNPQAYATGVKEIWKVKPENHEPGRVVHTLGWPADPDSLGGSWIYDMKDHMVSIGYVTHLDTLNPYNDPHDNMQRLKLHPWVRRLLDGAEIIRYGAKTMPVGGLFSQPRLYTEGALIVGDAASLCNGERLKGIHIAIRSGMHAAETLLEAVQKDDFSAQTLSTIEERWR